MKFYYIICFLLYFFISCKDCKTISVPYIVQEPYEVKEKRSIMLSFDNEKVFYKRIPGATLFGDNPKLIAECRVENTSDYNGEFQLYVIFESQGNKIKLLKSKYIRAHSIENINGEIEINPYTFKANLKVSEWGIIQPTVIVEETVTKYKDVVKYRICNSCDEGCE